MKSCFKTNFWNRLRYTQECGICKIYSAPPPHILIYVVAEWAEYKSCSYFTLTRYAQFPHGLLNGCHLPYAPLHFLMSPYKLEGDAGGRSYHNTMAVCVCMVWGQIHRCIYGTHTWDKRREEKEASVCKKWQSPSYSRAVVFHVGNQVALHKEMTVVSFCECWPRQAHFPHTNMRPWIQQEATLSAQAGHPSWKLNCKRGQHLRWLF